MEEDLRNAAGEGGTWEEKYRATRVELEKAYRDLDELRRDTGYDNSRRDEHQTQAFNL